MAGADSLRFAEELNPQLRYLLRTFLLNAVSGILDQVHPHWSKKYWHSIPGRPKLTSPMTPEREGELKGRIALFEQVITGFKRAQQEMSARRRGAADHVMVELDQRLEANARSLACFERSMAEVRETLEREEVEERS